MLNETTFAYVAAAAEDHQWKLTGLIVLAILVYPASLIGPLRQFFETLVKLTLLIVVGSVRALLPCGVLPRKPVKGNVVLVTGSGSGIGRLLAAEFGKLGARLVLWDVNEKGNEETRRMLADAGVEATAYTIDLSSRDAIYATAEKVKAEVGVVDVLVNNAGIVTGKKLFECPDELMAKTVAINTTSHFYTVKAFLPSMLERNHGHVVTIASMAGKVGVSGLVDYCASKFGAVGFSESLSSEVRTLGKDGVHVTTVCPYYIDTGMFDGVKTFTKLMPILKPAYVASRIMEAVLTNSEVLVLPRFCYFVLYFVSFLPSSAIHLLNEYFGINKSMDEFAGRPKVVS